MGLVMGLECDGNVMGLEPNKTRLQVVYYYAVVSTTIN